MKKFFYSFLSTLGMMLICSMATPVFAQKPAARFSVSPNSFGPVKVGMTTAQGSKALGVRLTRGADQENECYYVSPKTGFKGVAFMMIKHRIARIDIDDKRYATDRGARVGDTESRIKQVYKGQVRISQHPYLDTGHYLRIDMKGKNLSLIFETDGKRVTSYRVGRSAEVGYIEGCS
jgi:hypothetical protein